MSHMRKLDFVACIDQARRGNDEVNLSTILRAHVALVNDRASCTALKHGVELQCADVW